MKEHAAGRAAIDAATAAKLGWRGLVAGNVGQDCFAPVHRSVYDAKLPRSVASWGAPTASATSAGSADTRSPRSLEELSDTCPVWGRHLVETEGARVGQHQPDSGRAQEHRGGKEGPTVEAQVVVVGAQRDRKEARGPGEERKTNPP